MSILVRKLACQTIADKGETAKKSVQNIFKTRFSSQIWTRLHMCTLPVIKQQKRVVLNFFFLYTKANNSVSNSPTFVV